MNENSPNRPSRNDKVQLGCGTLILIALIVMIFSGGGRVDQLEHQIQGLQQEVRQLREAIEEHTALHQTNATPAEPELAP